MTLAEVREKRPGWSIEPDGLDLICVRGPSRFRVADPDDADREIGLREGQARPVPTLEEFAAMLAEPGL